MKDNNLIGIFDSGYGGLTVFKEIHQLLPQYEYIYLGDNSRAPYGTKSFDTVYHHTWQCVEWLINKGCKLIILACNTASARALRSIQQNELLKYNGEIRVLGVIRPTAEVIGKMTNSGTIGVLGTEGTIKSDTYKIEIHNFYPEISVVQYACKLWVPFVEDGDYDNDNIDPFIKRDLESLFMLSNNIDTILLGCTHYPLLQHKIEKLLPQKAQIISQGKIVAESLVDYLNRHSEIETKLSQQNSISFYTTDDPKAFENKGSIFFGQQIKAIHTSV